VIWHLFPRRYLATQVRMVALVCAVAGCLAFGVAAVGARMSAEPTRLPELVSFSAVAAFIAAAVACLVASVRIARCAQRRFDSRFPHRPDIVDAVVRGRDHEFSPDDRVLATKYAVALVPYLAFQLWQMLFILASLVVSLIALAGPASGAGAPLVIGAAAIAPVIGVAMVALWLVESTRVRRFLAANEHLLGASGRSTRT
jgi:amino acid transporter